MRPGDFDDRVATLSREGAPFAVAMTETSGSSPRKVGVKMIVLPDGEAIEAIGGGVLEKQVIADAREALRFGSSGERHYELRQQGEHALVTDGHAHDADAQTPAELAPRIMAEIVAVSCGESGGAPARPTSKDAATDETPGSERGVQ